MTVMICEAQRLYCGSLSRSRIGRASDVPTIDASTAQPCHRRIEARSLIDEAAEIHELGAMADNLADRLGRHDLAALEAAAQEVGIDQRA